MGGSADGGPAGASTGLRQSGNVGVLGVHPADLLWLRINTSGRWRIARSTLLLVTQYRRSLDLLAQAAEVLAFVEDPAKGLDLPLDVRGTAFQHRVWEALRRIPVGSTASYTEIAEKIGAPKAVRAVARACATNRIAVAIPCHRVIGSDGSLTGYRGGIERKRALLAKESGGKFKLRP